MSNLLPSQRTKFVANENLNKEWILVDAENQTLGRLAGRIAHRLMGKHRPDYAPHQDIGDYIVVINAAKITVTGNKLDQMVYYRHSGYPGGLKEATLRQKLDRDPTYALTIAVKRMLPAGPRGRKLLRNLKVYPDAKHLHESQQPKSWDIVFK